MKIKKIFIQAFRCFKEAEVDFSNGNACANLVALQAPNGFGKTSLLDAIEFGMTNRIERFEKANYKDDNVVDKKIRSNYSFLHNKERLDLPIKIKICLEDGQVIDKKYDEKTANLFGRNKRIENEYFRSVILSQDWFSEFISATDPEVRYETFLKYFYEGEDLVQYRLSIKKKWKVFDDEKDNLEQQIESLEEILSKPIASDIKQEYESHLNKLAENGIGMPKLEKYDKEAFNNCLLILKNQKEKVNGEHEHLVGLMAKLNDVLYGQTEYLSLTAMEEMVKQIFSERKDLIAKQALLLKQKLLGQFKQDLVCVEKLYEPLSDEKAKLSLGIKNMDDLKLLAQQIDFNRSSQKRYMLEIQNVQQTIPTFNRDFDVITDKYHISQKKYEQITNKVKNLDKDFGEYRQLLLELDVLQKKSDHACKNLADLKKNKEILESQLRLIQKIVSDVSLLIFSMDEDAIEKYKKEIAPLKREYDLQIEIENKIRQIDDVIKGQYAYKDEIQKLIIDAQNIQAVLKDGVCPVCGFDYKSSHALYERISSNTVLDESIKLQIEQKQLLTEKLKSLSETVKEKQKFLVDILNTDKKTCRKQIEKNIQEIQFREKDIDNVHLSIKKKSSQLGKWKGDFENLELEQVRKIFLSQQEKLLTDMKDSKAKLDQIIKKKDVAEQVLEDKSKIVELLEKEYQKLLSTPVLLAISDRMKIELLKEDFSCDVWNVRLQEVQTNLKIYESQIAQKKDSISKLEQEGILFDEYDSTKEAVKQIQREITNAESKLQRTLNYLKYQCLIADIDIDNVKLHENIDKLKAVVSNTQSANDEKRKKQESILKDLSLLESLISNLWHFMEYDESQSRKVKLVQKVKDVENKMNLLDKEIKSLEDYVDKYVDNFFDLDLINQLYKLIDPHPKYKHIKFSCDFSNIKPKLSVVVKRDNDDKDMIVPNLYFSTAQVNILSFCIFLAKALNAKDDNNNSVDCIFIDDPIQSLDDINILSLIDLLRNIAFKNNKQIVLTTHDRNFYELLKRKMPANLFNSKFLKLYERGKVMEDKVF